MSKWPEEKLRRSKVDWYSIVPHKVARSQVTYERAKTAQAMSASGMTYKEIAAIFDVSYHRARQIVGAGLRLTAASPVDAYFSGKDPIVKRAVARSSKKYGLISSIVKEAERMPLSLGRDWIRL